MTIKTAYERKDGTVVHYGVSGMRWGVRKQYDPLGGNKTGSKKKESKPKSTMPKKSPARMKAERQESMRAEIETLRSMGNSKMAEKLLKDYNDLYGPKSGKDLEKEAEEGPPGEEKEEEEEEKKGKGKAAAPKKEKPKEDPNKSKAEKAKELAKSQREVAKTFRAEAVAIKQDMAKMVANSDALRGRVAGFQKDLATAKKNGDPAAVKTMQGLLDRINERIASNEAGVKALQPTADRFDAKASEWEALADETLSTLKEDKKVKQSGLTNGSIYISHYGIKGQKWGVRRTREQLARLDLPRVAERRASKEARGMDEATLQKKIKRLQMEKQYSELVKSQTARDQTALEEGSLRVADVIYKSGTQAVGTVAGTIVAYGMIEGINKYAGTSIKNKKKSG